MDSADNTRQGPEASPFREAYFANSAASPSSVLRVIIPEFSADLPFGDPDGVVWSPIGGVLPQAGDRALVAESDDGSWWVLSWWSSAQTDASAVVARLAALEAKETRGSSSVTWPGGSTLSTATTVAHGLGSTPASVQVTPIYQVDGAGFTAQVSNVGATTFDVKLSVDSFSPVAATSRSFYWTASV